MKLERLAFSFLAPLLLLPTQVTAGQRTPKPTPPPTNQPTLKPCPAGQIETWSDLVDEVANSDGSSTNPTLITLCPRTFVVGDKVDLAGKYVDIKCGGTGTECVIDGRDSTVQNHAFTANSVSATFSASLEGLTFTNFDDELSVYSPNGNGFLAMKECTFTSNAGGGVRFDRGTLVIQDCLFESTNGAVQVGTGTSNTAVATISNSDFTDNTGNGRGAVECYGSGVNCVVSSSRFTGNQATTSGSGEGGAIHCNGATCAISGSVFTGNQASGTPGSGGAVYCGHGATCSISACTFLNNDALNGDNIYCTDDSLCNVDLCINESYNGGVSL